MELKDVILLVGRKRADNEGRWLNSNLSRSLWNHFPISKTRNGNPGRWLAPSIHTVNGKNRITVQCFDERLSAKLFPLFSCSLRCTWLATLLLPRVANTCYLATNQREPNSFWPNVKFRAHFVEFATSVPFATFDRYPAADLTLATCPQKLEIWFGGLKTLKQLYLLSTKNVGFSPDNFVGKEAQRQNVGGYIHKDAK